MTKLDESKARELIESGQIREATQGILEEHGAAFYGYIAALIRDDSLAADAFQLFSLRLWQGLSDFRWESSLTTWAYKIARNAAYRTLQDPYQRRFERLGTVEQEALAAFRTRTNTALFRQTAAKQQLWESIDSLAPEDRELLVLRLGRRMSWKDIARVLHGESDDPKELTRVAAKARKRFERIKARLQTDFGCT